MKIGDIVTYLGEGETFAALVGRINTDGTLNLTVIPDGQFLIAPWSIVNVPEGNPLTASDYVWFHPLS